MSALGSEAPSRIRLELADTSAAPRLSRLMGMVLVSLFVLPPAHRMNLGF